MYDLRIVWLYVGLLAAVTSSACRTRPAQPDSAPEGLHEALPRIEIAGCAPMRLGPICVVPIDRRITIWVQSTSALRAQVAQAELPVQVRGTFDGGTTYAVTIPGGARSLELKVSGTPGTLQLRLAEAEPTESLEAARRLRRHGRHDEARELLQRELPHLPPEMQDRARALLARIDLVRGDAAKAVPRLRATLHSAVAQGRITDAVEDATTLAYAYAHTLHEYALAREVLHSVASVAPVDAASAAILPYYEGLIARETGDLREALRLFREAARRTKRLEIHKHELLAREQEAAVLSSLGRHEEAIALQQEIVEDYPAEEFCQRAERYQTLIWFAYAARPAADSPLAQRTWELIDRASTHVTACDTARSRRNHWINVGLFAMQQAELHRASAALVELEASRAFASSSLTAWEHYLRGQFECARRQHATGSRHLQQARNLARHIGRWEIEHASLVATGECLASWGRSRAAVGALRASETVLDDYVGSVPLGEGRPLFLLARSDGARALVELLVQLNEPRQALEVARRSRSRLMRSVFVAAHLAGLASKSRAEWLQALSRYQATRDAIEQEAERSWELLDEQLPHQQTALDARRQRARSELDAALSMLGVRRGSYLPPREPDEAVLGYFRGRQGWLRFVETDEVTVTRLTSDALAGSAAAREAELVRGIELMPGIQRVRIVADAELSSVDFHALQLNVPLSERRPVTYGLDLASDRALPSSKRVRVLSVTNPRADLPLAESEEQTMLPEIEGMTERLRRAEASRGRVLAELVEASHFHYAGHGRFDGPDGLESGLELADGWLTLGDILTLPSAPTTVVLSACDGARARESGLALGVSVAEAFVAAGAATVVAASRPVADRTALRLMSMFYQELADTDPARALRAAQARLAADDHTADWAAFRVIVP